jgi:hypothetical protein
MSRSEYIENQTLLVLHSWTNSAIAAGSGIIVALSALDYFVTPENFKLFFIYRVITGTAILACYLINRIKVSRILNYIIMSIASILTSVMIALMIARFGGHQSPYYGGFFLSIIVIIGLAPLSMPMCIANSILIYSHNRCFAYFNMVMINFIVF